MTHPARYCPNKAQKPIRGSLLNRSHPLARGLQKLYVANQHSGLFIFDHVSGLHIDTLGSGDPAWDKGGFYCDSNDFIYAYDSSIDDGIVNAFTAYVRATVISFPNVEPSLLCFEYYEETNKPCLVILRYTTGGAAQAYFRPLSGDNTDCANVTGGSIVAGDEVSIVYTRSGANVALFLNGVEVAQSAVYASSNLDGNWDTTVICNFLYSLIYSVDNNGDAVFHSGGLWNRVLSNAEIQQLHREPYCMF